MFETLFTRPHALAAHTLAPCVESRKRFLVHCQELGYPPKSIRKIAWVLLVFSQSMDLSRPQLITHEKSRLRLTTGFVLFEVSARTSPAARGFCSSIPPRRGCVF